jgi:hypothetical protein
MNSQVTEYQILFEEYGKSVRLKQYSWLYGFKYRFTSGIKIEPGVKEPIISRNRDMAHEWFHRTKLICSSHFNCRPTTKHYLTDSPWGLDARLCFIYFASPKDAALFRLIMT